MHQYTSKGSIMGISGDVDLNRLYVPDAPVYVPEPLKDKTLDDAVDLIARRVIQGEFGEGHDQRKERIYKLIRQRVNDILK
jgi:GH25 family lysozyme M1 (1,4-beta-N-acetylmuramidase)